MSGAAGTTLDAFQLLHQSKKYGGRAALFGRKINQAENQLAFIEFLRHIADGVLEPEEAVKAYHAVLQKLHVTPQRSLEQDLLLQTNVMSYERSSTTISIPGPSSDPPKSPRQVTSVPTGGNSDAKPDFAKMTSAQRLQYHLDRLKRSLG